MKLLIKMKGMENTILYNRMFLPEFVLIDVADENVRKEILDRITSKQCLSPKTEGHTEFYDFQTERIKNIFQAIAQAPAL